MTLVVTLLIAVMANMWIAAAALFCQLPITFYESRKVLPSLLWDDKRLCWYTEHRKPVSVTSFRLAPWVIGVKYAGKAYWVWPDSSDELTLWAFRRALKQSH